MRKTLFSCKKTCRLFFLLLIFAGFLITGCGGNTSEAVTVPAPVEEVQITPPRIAAGWYHTCAQLTDGTVKCWGWNKHGQLGNGTASGPELCNGAEQNTPCSTRPVAVSGLAGDAAVITVGTQHTCALLKSGGVKCWGANSMGQLGDATMTDKYAPVDVTGLPLPAVSISTRGYHNCVELSDDSMWCWGDNGDAQLGTGSLETSEICTWDDNSKFYCSTKPVRASVVTGEISYVSTGDDIACVLLTGDFFKCWGQNIFGQLGDGTNNSSTTPVGPKGLDGAVRWGAGGWSHTCSLSGSGGMKCWGDNAHGQLGNGTTVNRENIPVDVTGLSSGVTAIALGGDHTCARLSGGSLQCWGWNANGQVGDGATTDERTPVNVPGLSGSVSEFTAGGQHTCALLSDDAIQCWGWNTYGQVGDGTTTDRLSPVTVTGL